MSGSQSLQDQTGSALGEVTAMGSPRPEMPPRQNSDPTSDTPTPPPRVASREERDRTAWLREEAMPPKVRVSERWEEGWREWEERETGWQTGLHHH